LKSLIVQDIFKIPKLIFGILFIVAGIASAFFKQYENMLVIPVGLSLLAHSAGLELDFENQKYRQYYSFFGKKKGDWFSLETYKAVIILQKEGKTSVVSTNMLASSTISLREHQVFLTDQTHRKRLYLKHFDTHEQARKFALEFMEKTGIPLERFDPVISQQTRNRR
jgi:hypothetical protein